MDRYVIELDTGERRLLEAQSIEVREGHLIAFDGWSTQRQIAAFGPGDWRAFWLSPNEESILALKSKLRAFDKLQSAHPDDPDVKFTRMLLEADIDARSSWRKEQDLAQLIETGRAEVER